MSSSEWTTGFMSVANDHVKSGLTRASILWSITGRGVGNWHPLTWLSLMADYQIGGLNPMVFHITNVILHLANALLLVLVLSRITGSFWRSAFVGALFALHPQHVESVAWISERKDVLSALFWMLAMLAYRPVQGVSGGCQVCAADACLRGRSCVKTNACLSADCSFAS